MAHRYRASFYRPATNWLSVYESMRNALTPFGVSILAQTPFYDTHDLDTPTNVGRQTLGPEEEDAIDRIAAALTIAANVAHATAPGIVEAWLEEIAKDPRLFWSMQHPPEVDAFIISHYRRTFEAPGTHLEDLLVSRRIGGLSRPKPATLLNISRAARSAAAALPRKIGRPANVANQILAEWLGRHFLSFGGRIVRRQIPYSRGSDPFKLLQDGPFYHFVQRVIEPLNAHLKQHGLPIVSSAKIEKIGARHFNHVCRGRDLFRPQEIDCANP